MAEIQARGECIVISQPMYFPWIGMLEQFKLCDLFVHYDDVQFSKGGFFNRVQFKAAGGTKWLTVPLMAQKLGQLINEVKINDKIDWRRSHVDQLKQAYSAAPFKRDMLELVDAVFSRKYENIGALARASMEILVQYYPEIGREKSIFASSELGIGGSGSQRVMDICSHFHASRYLTGHGAKNYLDHEGFERKGIDVAYIEYGLRPYSQSHGEFTPYVSALDLVAQEGRNGLQFIHAQAVPWREFFASHGIPSARKPK